MDKFITAQETIAKLQIKPFQLVTLIKTGQLQAHTEHGKRIVDADTLEKRPQRTVDEIYRGQKAKQGARVLGGPGSSWSSPMTENQLKRQAEAWYHDRFHNPLVIINQPPATEPVSFSISFPDGPRAAENVMKWLFAERDVTALLPTEHAETEQLSQQKTFIQSMPASEKSVRSTLNRTKKKRPTRRNKVLEDSVKRFLDQNPNYREKSVSVQYIINKVKSMFSSTTLCGEKSDSGFYVDDDVVYIRERGKTEKHVQVSTLKRYIRDIKGW